MAGNGFPAELRGNGHSAKCSVRTGRDGDAYICDVNPPLPEGDYELSANGLELKARHANGHWRQINE
jgi:hypothetical protein